MTITSEAFTPNGNIPVKYTCDGENINPALRIENIPDNTKSLVLIVDDPDAPAGVWHHWVIWNIPPTRLIKEDSIPGIEGMNDFNKHHYGGPCPPSGIHRYFFKVYALNTLLDLDPKSRSPKVRTAMKEHVLAEAELIGLYEREPWEIRLHQHERDE